jgi:hypothetical protein
MGGIRGHGGGKNSRRKHAYFFISPYKSATPKNFTGHNGR